jgi:four helix bundle protein
MPSIPAKTLVSRQLSAISRQLGEVSVQDFRDLKVWGKSHAVALATYKATEMFPAAERYGLTSQMRRSAASIPTNIAEGCVRSSDADFGRFLHIALGSASELEYLVLLAHDLRMLTTRVHGELTANLQEVKRMLTVLIARLRADS